MEFSQLITKLCFVFITSLLLSTTLSAEEFRDYYAEPGINPFKETLNQNFNESIDPFGGTLQLSYVDLLVPGNGGLDIQVNRSYTSLQGSLGSRDVTGVGWTMHFGKIIIADNAKMCSQSTWSVSVKDNPTFEFPDGRRELMVLATDGNYLVTKSRWKAECDIAGTVTITSPTGIKYLMDVFNTEGTQVSPSYVRYPSLITDLNGNTLTINYINNGKGYVYIDTVTASDGRLVKYNYIDDAPEGATSQLRLSSIVSNGQTWQYNYTLIPGVSGQYYQLSEVVRPDNTSWRYEYNPRFGEVGVVGDYSVKRVIYPYGGIIDYTYKPEFFNTDPLSFDPATSTIATKTISGPGITNGTWTFVYTPSDNTEWDITTVTTPNSVIKYYHYGYSSAGVGTMWSVGLQRAKEIYDTTGTTLIYQEINDWIPQTISNESYWHGRNTLRIDNDTAAPLLAKKAIWRDRHSFVTEYKNYDQYGNAGQTVESTNVGEYDINGTLIPDPGRFTDYTYDIDTLKWIVNRVKDETITDVGTISSVYDPVTGNLLSNNRYGVTTSYTYTPSGDIESTTDARANETRYYNYHRGTAQRVEKPEAVVIERLVNDTGTLAWEKDGRLNTTSYTYDDLNRLATINYPINADASIVWTTNSKTLIRGNYQEVVNFDGFGQQLEISRSDIVRGETITTTQQYDALGQKTFQSYPNSVTGTQYSYDELGRVIRVEHPDTTFSTTTYGSLADIDGKVILTDERGKITKKLYKSYGSPDERWLVTTISPENVATATHRNILGQPILIRQGEVDGDVYERTYTYDSRFYLESETNPETGMTLYGRDELGNMTSKQVGTSPVTYYNYDGLNRLASIDYPDTTPDVTYGYDKNNNVETVSNINSHRTYTYDVNNNLKTENIQVGGITSIISYDYDIHDALDTLTYPSGNQVVYKPNALGRSTQVMPYITSITYHPSGETKQITYANGQVTDYTLNDRLWLKDIKTNGITNVVDQTYTYDAAGNVGSIADALDPVFNRSFDYDGLNRLTVANGVWGSGSITYDHVGNITSKKIGELSRTLVYGNNRLSFIHGDVLGTTPLEYDVYGNVKRKGYIYHNIYYDHTYDDASNLINSTKNWSVFNTSPDPVSVIDYKYDGVNNRIERSSSIGDNIHYIFNKASNLLLEYDPSDARKNKEYIYFKSQLITKIENDVPASDAGADQAVYSGATVTLDGSASTAHSSSIFSYSWSQTSPGDVVTINNSSSSIASFTAPSVSVDTELTFDLTIMDETGLSHTDSVKVTVWMAAPSTAPINAVARQGDGQNTISWTSSVQADSYNIYWSTTPGVTPQTGTPILNVSTPYTHAGLTNGTNYYYVITAVNAYGESIVQEVRLTTGKNGWSAPYNTTDTGSEIEGIIPWAVSPSSGRAFKGYTANYGGLAVKHYEPGIGWSNEELVVTPADYQGASARKYSINNAGDIVILMVFSENINSEAVKSIKVIRYKASSKTWSSLETVRSWPDNWLLSRLFRGVENIDIDDSGNVFVIVEQSYSYSSSGFSTRSYYVLHYDAVLNTWTAPSGLNGYGTWGESMPGTQSIHSTINSAGQYFVMLAGADYDGAKFTYGLRYNPGSGWSPIDSMPLYNGIRKMHMADNGDVLIVMDSYADPIYYAVWNRVASGWEAPALFGDNATFYNSGNNKVSIAIDIDINGNAIVARQIELNTYSDDAKVIYSRTIHVNRYTPAGGWGGTHVLDTYSSYSYGNNLDFHVNMESSGNAFVTWGVDDSIEYVLRTSQYIWFGSTYPDQSLSPVAFAGSDTSGKEGAIITLSGSGYDPDGGIISYQWSQVSGPTATFIDANTSTAKLRLPTVASNTYNLGFKLTVIDSDGAEGTDIVEVDVINLDYPVVQTITPGDKQNTITWTSDPDAPAANLYWSTSPSVLEYANNLVSSITSPYVHTGLQNGVKIYYTLVSVDGNGNANEEPRTREFFSTPLENRILWSEPEKVGNGFKPLVTMNKDGDANILYDSSSANGVMGNQYSKASGQGVPEQVCGLPNINNKYFASDLNGNGFIAWVENASIDYTTKSAFGDSIWACQFDANTGWGSPFQITFDNSIVYGELKIVANSRGDFVLAWNTGSNSYSGREIYIKRYIAGSGWQANEKVSSSLDKDLNYTNVSINQTGDIAVVWRSKSNTSPYVYETISKQFSMDTGLWTAEKSIQQTQNFSKRHAISIDEYENVIVAWCEDENTATGYYQDWNVYANRYDRGTDQWSGAGLLNSTAMNNVWDDNELEIASDDFGNTVVVWEQHVNTPDGLGGYIEIENININEYKIGVGWNGPVAISDSRGIDTLPKIVMNKKGDLVAVWRATKYTISSIVYDKTYGGNVIVANYRPAGADWIGEQVITLHSGHLNGRISKEYFDVAIDPTGNAIISVNSLDEVLYSYVDISTMQAPLNIVPIANAGSDQQILINNQVALNANLSADPDGIIANYAWYQVDGPAVTLSNASIVNPIFTVPVVSVNTPITFLLTVTDDYGHTNSDLVVINVLTGLSANNPPSANDDSTIILVDTNANMDVVSNDTDVDGDSLSVTAITQGSNGSVVINADNTITYTPSNGLLGDDSFTYTIIDGNGGASIATVNVSVREVLPNAIPVANTDTSSTTEDSATTSISVLSNDTDADGDTLSITAVIQGSNGSVAINADTVIYTPNLNFNGSDSFTYTISDGNGGSDTGTVNVTVTPVNDIPVANDDAVVIVEDTVASAITILANDTDAEGNTLSVTTVTQGANGNVVITGNTVSYTPNTHFNGSDTFNYTIDDGSGGNATATVSVTVTPVNDTPAANDDVFNTTENIPVNVNVLSNDSDVDGDTLSVTDVTQAANGSVVLNADNSINYTPNNNFTGNDTFTYTISDGNGGTASATVSVSVNNTVAINYEYSLLNPGLSSGAAQVISLANNNTIQVGSTVLTLNQYEQGVIPATDMQQGTTIQGSGPFDIASSISATDMPVPSQFEGTQFVIPHYRNNHTYYLLSTSGNATVQIKIGTTTTPVSLPQGQVITFNAGSNNTLSGTITSDLPIRVAHRANSTGNIDANPVPPAALEVWGVRTNTITVGALNDGTNITVTAHDGSSTSLVLNAGGRRTVNVGVSGSQGMGSGIHISADQPIAALQSGDGDGADQSAFLRTQDLGTRFGIPTDAQYAAVVCPTVGTSISLYNNQGILQSQQTCSGTAVGKAYFGSNTSGANIASGSYLESDQPIYVMYEDSATNDEHNLLGSASSVSSGNTVPVAQNDSANTAVDTMVTITVLSNDTDADGDSLTVSTVTQGTNGSVLINTDNTIDYTPNPSFSGNDSFNYTIADGNGGTATATVSVSITAVNTVPVAIDDNIVTAEDTVASAIAVLSNDSDTDGDTLTVATVTQGINGSVVINTDNTVNYTPNANFNGNDSFSYTMNDGNGGNATGIVSVMVTAVNDLPAANDDSISTAQDISVTINVLSNDTDVDGDVLSVTTVTQGANGSVTINTDDSVSYTPNANFNGNDSFTYTVSDGVANAIATVNVTITALSNTAPQITNPGSQNHVEGDNVNLAIIASDADNDTLSYSNTGSLPAGVSLNLATGVISGTLSAGSAGNYNAAISVSDGNATVSTSFNWSVSSNVITNYEYSLLNPGLSGSAAQVISLANNNTIQAGSTVLNLNQYEQGIIPAIDMQQGVTVQGSGPFDIASSISATDMPVPNQFEGTQFVIPHYRNTHYYYLLSTSGNATAQITIGTTTTPVSLPQGQVITFNAGSNNNLSGIITSDLPIRVAHRANDGGNIDGNPVPPAALEVWGVRSNNATIGALNDGTTVTITVDDGTSSSISLNAGGRYRVTTGKTGGAGKGSGLRISADQPIAAIQSGDGDGADQTAFMRTQDLGTRFGIPTDAQYATIVCPTIGTIVTLYDNQGNSLAQQTCSGTLVGKAYFGATTSGANITAGSYLESDQPIYVMYEDSATNDEHNLLGVVGQ